MGLISVKHTNSIRKTNSKIHDIAVEVLIATMAVRFVLWLAGSKEKK